MDLARLNELISRAQALSPGTQDWEDIVDSIVSMLLQTRRITRLSNGSLAYISHEICQDAREPLKRQVALRLESGFLKGVCLDELSKSQREEWKAQLRDYLFGWRDDVLKKVLTHRHLDLMAYEAQRAKQLFHETASESKQQEARKTLQAAIDMLYEAVDLVSERLSRSHKGRYPLLYRQIWDEAFNRTFEQLVKSIERYDPNEHFLAWFNYSLEKRVLDVYKELPDPLIAKLRERAKRKLRRIKGILYNWLISVMRCQPPKSISIAGCFCLISSLFEVETQFYQVSIDDPDYGNEPSSSASNPLENPIEVIREMVKRDLNDRYKSRYLRRNKMANFQAIFLDILNSGLERIDMLFWEEISKKYAATPDALRVAFYCRWIPEFWSDFEDLL